MCTYETTTLEVRGSAKSQSWMRVTDATVYFDHPVHFPAGHALLVDLRDPEAGAGARVGIELDAASARSLAHAILDILERVPAELREEPVESPQS